jgi:chitin disaccharide deacetylase
MTERALIVNADDFGMSMGTNEGIIVGHERGIVTSASLMVYGDAAEEAAGYAKSHPELSVGLHVDLGEWVFEDGAWIARYERVPAVHHIPQQLERFRALVGSDPTHLDSHQHVHREEPARTLVEDLAKDLGVPLRECGSIAYAGGFYGQTGAGEPLPEAIRAETLIELVSSLPPGVTELGCHPGLDAALDSPYRLERLQELDALCDPRVRQALEHHRVRLASF